MMPAMNASGIFHQPVWAARLHAERAAFLNQLLHLDQTHLIVRTNGLSIAKWTEFGVFFSCRLSTDTIWLNDPVSGVAIDPSQIRAFYAARLGPDEPISFEIEFLTGGIALSIQTDAVHSSLDAASRIVNAFGIEPVAHQSLRQLGAGAWLDDWRLGDAGWANVKQRSLLTGAVAGCCPVSIQLSSPGLIAEAKLCPSFLDFDGPVARFADPTCETVCLTDLASPCVRVEEGVHSGNVHISSYAPLKPRAACNERAGARSLAGTPC